MFRVRLSGCFGRVGLSLRMLVVLPSYFLFRIETGIVSCQIVHLCFFMSLIVILIPLESILRVFSWYSSMAHPYAATWKSTNVVGN